MKKYWVVILAMFLLLTGCFGGENLDTQNGADSLIGTKAEVLAEVAEGDFIYRLVSKKSVYTEGEKVEVYGELEYVGDEPEIKIAHAASPFYFPVNEKIRGYDLFYIMKQPRLISILKKGEPLREYFKGAGGYGSRDPQEYVDFVKAMAEALKSNTLPWGAYQIFGSAQFETVHDTASENESVHIEAKIGFFVEENK